MYVLEPIFFLNCTQKLKGNLVANCILQYPGRSSNLSYSMKGSSVTSCSSSNVSGYVSVRRRFNRFHLASMRYWGFNVLLSLHIGMNGVTSSFCVCVCTHWATHTVIDLTHNGLILCGEQTDKGVFLQPFIWPRGPVGTQRAPLNSRHETGRASLVGRYSTGFRLCGWAADIHVDFTIA
jgi:hypothetical protein